MCAISVSSSDVQVTPREYACTIASTVKDLLTLRDEWTDLLLHSQMANVFLSWEWVTTWMRTHGRRREPYVLLLRRADDGLLVGLAPLCRIEPRYPLGLRTVALMGTGVGADHLSFLSRQGMEAQVYSALAGHLLSANTWDVLELPRLEEAFAGHLVDAFAGIQPRLAFTSTVADLCPFVPLPNTWDEYLRVMHQRPELGRRRRRLQEQGDVVIQRVQRLEELEDAWDALLRLHHARRQAVGGRSAFLAPQSKAFHELFVRQAFDRGWLRLYLLRVDGRCVAAEYCLQVGRRLFGFQGGFDMNWGRYWVRSIVVAHAIRTAIEEGATEYDLSRGAEQYKQQRWGALTRKDISLVAWRRYPRVRVMMTVRGWSRALIERLRRHRAGAADTESPNVGDQK